MQMAGLVPCLPLCHLQACSLERRMGVEKASSYRHGGCSGRSWTNCYGCAAVRLTSPAASNVCNKMSTTRTHFVPTWQGNVLGGVADRRSA